MVRIQLDPEALAVLTAANERVEIIDESGRVIGYYESRQAMLERALEACPYTEEELEEHANNASSGRTLSEILRDLGEA